VFQPRPYQLHAMQGLRDKKRGILLWARRIGKDYTCFQIMLERALSDTGQYYYVFPSYVQAKKALWDLRDNEGRSLKDLIPSWALGGMNSLEMKIRLKSGSLLQLVGSENPDALRGTNPKGIVFSEFAMCDPHIWTAVAKPILAQNRGWALFASTPMGRNHFHELWQMASKSEDWYTSRVTAPESGAVTEEIIEADRREGMSEELIQQEYFVSFVAGADGLIYGQQMDTMDREGRIRLVPVDRAVPVHTAWDFGVSDSTAIVAFQLLPGNEIHVVNFYESSGKAIHEYIDLVKSWNYTWGKHFAPHDVEARSLQTGITLKQMASKLGIAFVTLKPTSVEAGIQLTRQTLGRCWIDEQKGMHLLRHLRNYKRAWDNKSHAFTSTIVHDEHSHAADAMRYMSQGVTLLGGNTGRSGSDVRNQHLRDPSEIQWNPYK
jgi:phage terminase large subunit